MGMEKGIIIICMVTIIFKEKELKNQLIPYSNRLGFGQLCFLWGTSKVNSILTKCWLWMRMLESHLSSVTSFRLLSLFEPHFSLSVKWG